MNISSPLTLPCGIILPNRIAKSAMSENMAKKKNYNPGDNFFTAYETWLNGGTGLLISGNVMIDENHLGEANNVVISKDVNNHTGLSRWANVIKKRDQHLWIQLNHPGKQSPKFLTKEPVAPSAISFDSHLKSMFNTPRELSSSDIYQIIDRFAYAASIVQKCGFSGVQIHGAHGYLVSQFLSPLHNLRKDCWGGSVLNRMRFVTEVYQAIRKRVGKDFPIGIKLNSADFIKGGFSHEDSLFVAKKLSDLGIDLIEISGGSYEAPVMTGITIKESTKNREAYFLEFTKDIRKNINCPLMVTGGFRTGGFMNDALNEDELDLIGLGRPLCLNPNFSNELMTGEQVESQVKPLTSGFRFLDKLFPLEIIWYTLQIHRIGKGKMPNKNLSVIYAILSSLIEVGIQSFKKVRS